MNLKLEKATGLPYKVEDLSMRLQDSLIMYNGLPFYVERVDGATLVGQLTLTGEPCTVNLPDEMLDVSAQPLGYVNGRRSCTYLSRNPVRKFKQGLCRFNVFSKYPVEIRSSDVAKMVLGVYPSFEEAFNLAKGGRGVAFSRHWAVQGREGLRLEYKGETVGWFSFDAPVLSSEFMYLQESLDIAREL